MSFNLFKAFQLFGIVSSWAVQALADGVVTLSEAVSLVTQLCTVLGVSPQLDIPGASPEPEVIPDTSVDNPTKVNTDVDKTSENRAPPEDISPKLKGVT